MNHPENTSHVTRFPDVPLTSASHQNAIGCLKLTAHTWLEDPTEPSSHHVNTQRIDTILAPQLAYVDSVSRPDRGVTWRERRARNQK